MRLLTTGAAALLLMAGTAMAQTDWDANADGQIDQDEFSAGLESDGPFDDWDTDRDESLSREEFDAGMMSSFDTDGDGILNEPEGVTLDAMRTGWDADQSR